MTAASDWGADPERKRLRPALEESYEALFTALGMPAFLLLLAQPDVTAALAPSRLERAIGVIYRPEIERLSHYFHASLPKQFDAVIHIDETNALEPLETSEAWRRGDAPETYPTGV